MSRSSSAKISLALLSSIEGSGSPLVNNLNGVGLEDLAGGMKETETEVGEMVPSGTSV
jgi:hypothetical protein